MFDEPRAPVRPSIPPLAWGAVGLWCGVTAAEGLSWRAWLDGVAFDLSRLVLMLGTCLIIGLTLRRKSGAVMMTMGWAVGLMLASLFWVGWHGDALALTRAGGTRWVAEARTDPRSGRFGERSEVQLETAGKALRLSVAWPEGEAPESGRRVEFFGAVASPGTDEFARRQHQSGVCGSISARQVKNVAWHRSARGLVGPMRGQALEAVSHVQGSGGDLLQGIVLGDRRRLRGTQTESDFRTTGLSHLVAVSGSHLAVVACLIAWALGALRVRRSAVAAAVVSILGLYVVTTGVQPSAVRAWAMAAVGLSAGLSGRRNDSISALSAAASIALVTWPPVAFDLGFRLSVVSVAGLVVFNRLTTAWAKAAVPRAAGALVAPIALTLTAQMATLPMTVAIFSAISLIAPLANLIVGPLVSLIVVVGLVGTVVHAVVPVVGVALLRFAGAIGGFAAYVAGVLSRVPYASVPLGSAGGWYIGAAFAAMGALWFWWPVPRRRHARAVALASIVLCVAVALGPPAPGGVSIVMLDVGQGDAILIRDGRHAALIDTGPDVAALRSALARHGVRRLDALILTHLHADHVAGTEALVGLVPVERVLVAEGAAGEALRSVAGLRSSVEEVRAGAVMRVGDAHLTVVSPSHRVEDGSENSASVVVLMQAPGMTALLTGDAEADVLDPLASSGVLGDIDVLKVGHHGSAGAVSAECLETLRPELALVSVGEANRYGHPVASTIDLLELSGTKVLRTDRGGDVTVRTRGGSVVYTLSRRGVSLGPYATLTLVAASGDSNRRRGAHEPDHVRPQTAVSDLERSGVSASACTRKASISCCGGRGYRFQLRGLRGRVSVRRYDSCRVQHLPLRLRAPPRCGAERREALERRT